MDVQFGWHKYHIHFIHTGKKKRYVYNLFSKMKTSNIWIVIFARLQTDLSLRAECERWLCLGFTITIRVMSGLLCVWLIFNSSYHHNQGTVSLKQIRVDVYTPHTHALHTTEDHLLTVFFFHLLAWELAVRFLRVLINVQHEEEAVQLL